LGQLGALPVPHLLAWAVAALVPVVVGAVVYFGAARLLRLTEADALLHRRRR
jgi:hypothetical protein